MFCVGIVRHLLFWWIIWLIMIQGTQCARLKNQGTFCTRYTKPSASKCGMAGTEATAYYFADETFLVQKALFYSMPPSTVSYGTVTVSGNELDSHSFTASVVVTYFGKINQMLF